MEVLFNEATHTYTCGGEVIPSVTQIISSVDGNNWGDINADVMAKAQQRGTAVHSITEYHDKGVLDGETVDPALRGYYDAYLAFLSDCKPIWDLIEYRICNLDLGYAGTLDRAGTMNNKPVILDVKTGAKSKWTGVQLSAYQMGAKLKPSTKRFGLYLAKDGKYNLVPYTNQMDWNIFLSAVNIWKFNK